MYLSIIVPVYNVEKYIRPCLESIFFQGLNEKDYEVIVVNDGTRDRSMEVVDSFQTAHSNMTIIHQENQGLSIARNTGMKHAKGDYIAFLDSDDILAKNSLKSLFTLTIRNDADLVFANFLKLNDEDIEQYLGKEFITSPFTTEVKSGKALLIQNLNPRECYVWRTLYKRAFLLKNNIAFIPSITYEDIPFTHECILKARKVIKTDLVFYIYRQGHASITHELTVRKGKDLCISIARIWELTQTKGLDAEVKACMEDHVFASFSVLLYAIAEHIHNSQERKQIIQYLKQLVPKLAFHHGMKQRLITWLYKTCPYLYLNMRVFQH